MDPQTLMAALMARFGVNPLDAQQTQRFLGGAAPNGAGGPAVPVAGATGLPPGPTNASLIQQPPPWSPLSNPVGPTAPAPLPATARYPDSTDFPTGLPQPPPRPSPAMTGGAGATGAPAASNPFSTFHYDVPGSGRGAAPIYTARNFGPLAPRRAPGVDPSIQARGGYSPPVATGGSQQPSAAGQPSNLQNLVQGASRIAQGLSGAIGPLAGQGFRPPTQPYYNPQGARPNQPGAFNQLWSGLTGMFGGA